MPIKNTGTIIPIGAAIKYAIFVHFLSFLVSGFANLVAVEILYVQDKMENARTRLISIPQLMGTVCAVNVPKLTWNNVIK